MKCVLRSQGKRYRCVIKQDKTKIYFVKSPYALKNELKAMKGSRWNPDARCWSATRCSRNMFQLRAMMVEPQDINPYEHFEQPVKQLCNSKRPLQPQQIEIVNNVLTYHYRLEIAEMGLGKSLAAMEIIEHVGLDNPAEEALFLGPRSALESVEADRVKWDGPDFKTGTYEYATKHHKDIVKNPPRVLICDESDALKNPSSQRTRAVQKIADAIRTVHGMDGYVVLMSGSPSAKAPGDLWAQCEIVWPGFLREGSLRAFEDRYANIVKVEDMDGVTFRKIDGWKEKEVAKLPARMDGLATVYRFKDYVKLPERTFEVRTLKPSGRVKAAAKMLASSADSTIQALTWLRCLSSGFQYDDSSGTRQLVETFCPKDDVLREILGEDSSIGRSIVYASFQGSIDRVRNICTAEGWDVCQIDGRGWQAYKGSEQVDEHVLSFWKNNPNKTVVVGNPGSCRYGLTLNEAKTITVFDQNFSAVHRLQSLARNYRLGQDSPVRVVDLIHLPVDQLILDTLKSNRKLELLSLGQIIESLE